MMKVSRQTFQRILSEARAKIARALVEGKTIRFSGGDFTRQVCKIICSNCNKDWEESYENFTAAKDYKYRCPNCGSDEITCCARKKSRFCSKKCCSKHQSDATGTIKLHYQGGNNMKIAIPNNNGEVNQHFGQSQIFSIIELDNDKKIVKVEDVEAAGLQHHHEGLAGLLKDQGVEVVIVGGIGAGAINALEAMHLKVLFGASGPIKDVAETFAKGEFISERKMCSHHGEHHDHGGCSH